MTSSGNKDSPQQGYLAAPLVLLGVAVGFVGCCLAGHIFARLNCLRDFRRFHPCIDYRTLYYPTVSQVRSLAREKLPRDRIAVVIGGNSVLQGVGQGAAGNWADRLQELLGEDFRVLNLALPNLLPFEFGSVAAEVLLRDHPRLIFLTNNLWPVTRFPLGEPDGRPLVRYFYWQAQARGLLADGGARDTEVRRLEYIREEESFRELQRQCVLDVRLGFHDLWNAVTYRYASTVWCPPLAGSWTKPRGASPDLDSVLPPVSERRAAASAPKVLTSLRDAIMRARRFVPPSAGKGHWREPNSLVPRSVRQCLPPCLRGRTLVLLNHICPLYLNPLTVRERHTYSRSFEVMRRLFARAGVRAAEVNRDLPAEYFTDSVHLTAEGGRRLAEEVAPEIRALAAQLGYRR